MKVSPFSLSNDWTLGWKRIPSSYRPMRYYNINSMKERKALKALASVGLIGGKQLFNLFSIKRKEISNMLKTDKLVKHELNKSKEKIIPIYTLGINGAKAIKLDIYEENYWINFDITDVLKRLLFFQLYRRFSTHKVYPAPNPFVSAIENNNNIIYVYVLKGDIGDLLRYLKWELKSYHRIIIVTESVDLLQPLDLYIKDLKLRVVLEKDLINNEMNEVIFYQYQKGTLIR